MRRIPAATGYAHFFAGRYDEAAAWAATALRECPDFHAALRVAAASNALAGRAEEAMKARERLQQFDPALRVSNLGDISAPYIGWKMSPNIWRVSEPRDCRSDRR